MISEEQKTTMLKKLKDILSVMNNTGSIKEISDLTKIPTSTIQRYLNRKDLLLELLNDDVLCEKVFKNNQEWLKKSKEEGLKRGGENSQINNYYIKDELGRFNGNKKK